MNVPVLTKVVLEVPVKIQVRLPAFRFVEAEIVNFVAVIVPKPTELAVMTLLVAEESVNVRKAKLQFVLSEVTLVPKFLLAVTDWVKVPVVRLMVPQVAPH